MLEVTILSTTVSPGDIIYESRNSLYRNFFFHSVEEAINGVLEKQQFADHHLEHELASVDDNLKHMISKLERKETDVETRIDKVEKVSLISYD